jgi:hypothetical protein
MKKPLPARDQGGRTRDFVRQSPAIGSMPVRRATPPSQSPAAAWGRDRRRSGLQGVGAFPVVALGGNDRQCHLLPQGSGQKAAHAGGLPARGFHQGFKAYSARLLQQFQHRRCFAPGAGAVVFFGAFDAFLAFLPTLPLLGATWPRRAPAAAFLLPFSVAAWAVSVSSAFDIILISPSAVIPAITTSIPLNGYTSK